MISSCALPAAESWSWSSADVSLPNKNQSTRSHSLCGVLMMVNNRTESKGLTSFPALKEVCKRSGAGDIVIVAVALDGMLGMESDVAGDGYDESVERTAGV